MEDQRSAERKRNEVKKRKRRTTLGGRFYVWAMLLSLALILLNFLMKQCACTCGCTLLQELVEILAAGIFPSVVFAFLTDWAGTNRQQEDYKRRIKCQKGKLKQICGDLPLELLNCINTPVYRENDEERTFRQWNERLLEIGGDTIESYSCELLEIEKEVGAFLNEVEVFSESIFDEARAKEKEKAATLQKSCRRMRREVGHKNVERFLAEVDLFIAAVLAMLEDCEEYDRIKEDYCEPYNSETFAE